MRQIDDEITQHVAERWCGAAARRDDARVARRLYRTQEADGVYRLDEGAVLDDCFHFLQALGVMALVEEVHGTAIQRERLPSGPDVVRYGLKTWCGIERMNALPPLLCSDAALRPWVGFKAQQVRQGICQRGATTRQDERAPGPIGPDTLAQTIVQWHVRDLECVCNGAIRALATAGVCGQPGTGMADGTDLETTERDTGGGQVTRQGRLEETRGPVHAIEVTVHGWNVLLRIDAVTTMPLAVNVGQMQAPEALWARALVTHARLHLAGDARRSKVVFDQGFGAGTTRWWLEPQGIRVVVPAKAQMAVTAEARAQAAAGEGITVARRVQTVRHGPGKAAWTEGLETAVVGITGLTTDDPYGTPEQARDANRRDFPAHPIHAVVVRKWQGQDDGPGGTTVFRTTAPVDQPWRPFDADDARRLMEHCGIKAAKPPWALGHPPQKSARAVRVHVVFTRLLFALATGSRRPCAREATGGEPVGWHRWRRPLLEQTREPVMVCAQGD